MKTKRLFLSLSVLLALLLVGSCKTSDPEAVAQREIRDLMYNISVNFNLSNITPIMDYLHSEYLHKGLIAYHFNDLWLDRMAQFSLLEIEVLYIEIQGDLAVVHSNNKFSSAYETLTLHEPEDSGDISYLKRDNGVWQIYGNQQWSKQPIKGYSKN